MRNLVFSAVIAILATAAHAQNITHVAQVQGGRVMLSEQKCYYLDRGQLAMFVPHSGPPSYGCWSLRNGSEVGIYWYDRGAGKPDVSYHISAFSR